MKSTDWMRMDTTLAKGVMKLDGWMDAGLLLLVIH